MSIKYYYHGSSTDIKDKYLSPMPSKVLGGEKAVFATNDLYVALLFIPKWSDCDVEFGYYRGQSFIGEHYPGAFDKIFLNKDGYIYYVNSKNFENDERLGLKNIEFISKKKTAILKKKYIKDVFAELKKSPINFITHNMKMEAISKYFKPKK